MESKNEQLKSRKFLCSSCEKLFDFNPSGHITQITREEHLSRQDKVICYTCHEQRPTYICSRCGKTGQREDFQKTNFDRACKRGTIECLECQPGRRKGKVCILEQDQRPTYTCCRCDETGPREIFQAIHLERDCKRGTQQCLECKSGRRKGKVCILKQCKKFVREENVSQTQQKHATRGFVCETCTEQGYTSANTHTYTCASCEEVTGGHGLFQTPNFRRAVKRGTQKCKSCFR